MSEWHDTGLSRADYYRMAVHEVNSEFDRKQQKRSFFTSKVSIENDRNDALKKVDESFHGRGGGGMCE